MELVDVYNERHEKLNYSKGRKELNDGEYRLSCFIWVINDKNETLELKEIEEAEYKEDFDEMSDTSVLPPVVHDTEADDDYEEDDEFDEDELDEDLDGVFDEEFEEGDEE